MAIDDALALGVAHGDLSVAFEGQTVEVVSSAIPSRCLRELVNIDGLTIAVARKNIVKAKGIPSEILIEVLCCCRHRH